MRQSLPNDESEDDESDASHRCADCIHARSYSATFRAFFAGTFLFLLLMFFDQSRCRRKDGGKRQEEAADFRAKAFCDDSRQSRNGTAENKTDKIFRPV